MSGLEWDYNFVKSDRYKIAAFLFPKSGSTSIGGLFNELEGGGDDWTRNLTNNPPDDYRVFCFVRNPYSRVFSSYSSITYRYMLEYDGVGMKFSEFIIKYSQHKGFENWPPYMPFKRQVHRFPDHTELYRWEEFEDRITDILESIGVHKYPVPHHNRTYAITRGLDYRDFYTKLSKAAISRVYRWDLENLHYTFDSYGKMPTVPELKKNL